MSDVTDATTRIPVRQGRNVAAKVLVPLQAAAAVRVDAPEALRRRP